MCPDRRSCDDDLHVPLAFRLYPVGSWLAGVMLALTEPLRIYNIVGMSTTPKPVAYLGDPALKTDTLAMIAAHREADELAKGAYVSENGKTTYCAVGCVLKDPDGGHSRYATEYGIPGQLAWLEDSIFEALPDDRMAAWPGEFMAAIRVGADLSGVWPRFAAWMMVDPQWGVTQATDAEDVREVCQRVASAYLRLADGCEVSDKDAQAITYAARAAWDAWDARDARAITDDARAAWDAWDARDARATRAAWAAWDAWDARDARDARTTRTTRAARATRVVASADKLLGLLAAT